MDNCKNLNIVQVVRYPNEDKRWLQFEQKSLKKTVPLPFIVYADFKSILEDCPGADQCSAAYQKHVPFSCCINVKSIDDKWNRKPQVYTGLDCMEKFMETMDLLNREIREVFKLTNPMVPLTSKEQRLHEQATHCYTCKLQFGSTGENERILKKVRDHCHITGKYQGCDSLYIVWLNIYPDVVI